MRPFSSFLTAWASVLALLTSPHRAAAQQPAADSAGLTPPAALRDSVAVADTAAAPDRRWALNGYVKNMVTGNPTDDQLLLDNLVHHRLNLRWFPSSALKLEAGVRNRLFFGETVGLVPGYGALVDTYTDYADLSFFPAQGRNYLWHVDVDRAYAQWSRQDWEVTVGRQRVNWGLNLVWNPNDIFNVYNFFDFDYEERPGSDAVRVVRYTGQASSLEAVGTLSRRFEQTVVALMRKWNAGGYDFQLFAGKARRDLALGAGWAGSVGGAGLKGEATYLRSYTGATRPVLLASVSADYSFPNTLYLHGSVLLNTAGRWQPDMLAFNTLSGEPLTVRSLSPHRLSTFGQVGYRLHPLLNTSVAAIYYPGTHGLFLNPGLTCSVRNNLDLDLLGQFYWDQLGGDYQSLARPVYLRLKWSY